MFSLIIVLCRVLTNSAGAESCYGDLCSNQTKQERLENIPCLTHHGCHRGLDEKTKSWWCERFHTWWWCLDKVWSSDSDVFYFVAFPAQSSKEGQHQRTEPTGSGKTNNVTEEDRKYGQTQQHESPSQHKVLLQGQRSRVCYQIYNLNSIWFQFYDTST